MSQDGTGFLYPFIESDERDVGALLEDLAASADGKAAESARVTAAALTANEENVAAGAAELAARFGAGGRLFVFGNGGSSTDAAAAAELFCRPPHGMPLPAQSLAEETAVLTALGNDIGFDGTFSRQVIAHCHERDAVIGYSTSGGSANVLAALAEARRRSVLTIGMAGYDGGAMAASADVDHCFVVASDSVHRIQEAQARLSWELWHGVQDRLARPGVAR